MKGLSKQLFRLRRRYLWLYVLWQIVDVEKEEKRPEHTNVAHLMSQKPLSTSPPSQVPDHRKNNGRKYPFILLGSLSTVVRSVPNPVGNDVFTQEKVFWRARSIPIRVQCGISQT